MKIRWWLASLTTTIALAAVAPTSPATAAPAQPHIPGSAVDVQSLLGNVRLGSYDVEVIFDATDQYGRSLCLDAADGQDPNNVPPPQADVWGCGANGNLLIWTISLHNATEFDFQDNNLGGCLDYGAHRPLSNGQQVTDKIPTGIVCDDPGNQTWSLYYAADDDHMYLAPAGGFSWEVVSPIGTHPLDGAKLNMWRTNPDRSPVNVSQYVILLCEHNPC